MLCNTQRFEEFQRLLGSGLASVQALELSLVFLQGFCRKPDTFIICGPVHRGPEKQQQGVPGT